MRSKSKRVLAIALQSRHWRKIASGVIITRSFLKKCKIIFSIWPHGMGKILVQLIFVIDIVLMALHTQYKSYGDTENVFKFVDKSLRRDADVKKARAGGEVTRNKEMVFEGEGGEYQLNIHTSTEAKEYMKDIESSNPLDYFDGGQGGNVSAFYGIELGELETQFPKAEIELIADNKNFSSPIPPSQGKHIEELYVTKGEVYSEGFVVQIDAEEEFEEEEEDTEEASY